jgi:hypothetical protein
MPEPAPKAAMKFGAGVGAVVAALEVVLLVAEVVVMLFYPSLQ